MEENEEVKQNEVIEEANELQFEDQKYSLSMKGSEDDSSVNVEGQSFDESKDSE